MVFSAKAEGPSVDLVLNEAEQKIGTKSELHPKTARVADALDETKTAFIGQLSDDRF